MGLLSGITIDKINLGDTIGKSFEGLGTLAKDLRTALTGTAPIDATKMAELKAKALELEQAIATAQTDTNKIEAASSSKFVAGWRPFIGWVCGLSLGVYYIPRATMATVFWCYAAYKIFAAWTGGYPIPDLPAMPEVGIADIFGLVASMLGMSWLRTKEKEKSVQDSH